MNHLENTKSAKTDQLTIDTSAIYDAAVERLRSQLWVGMLTFTLISLITTRLLRYVAGVRSTPLAIVIQLLFYTVIIAGLLLRNTRHTMTMRTTFLLVIHLTLPPVILVYGGNQGFGDLMFFLCVVVSAVYGWRRWMFVTFAISTAAFGYAFYLDLIGRPLNPFVDNFARFSALKILIFLCIASFTLYLGRRFYRQLLDRYRQLAEQQSRLTERLERSTNALNQLSAELQASREQIVTAREEERRHLHHDLQAQLGPSLVALGYRAGAVRNAIRNRPDRAPALLDDLEANIKTVLHDVRAFAYALYPPLLDQLGLIGAIHAHVGKLKAPFTVVLDMPESLGVISASAEITLFRLVQTLLDIALENDDTTRIEITLRRKSAVLLLTVVGDGIESAEMLKNKLAGAAVIGRFDELGDDLRIESADSSVVSLHARVAADEAAALQ